MTFFGLRSVATIRVRPFLDPLKNTASKAWGLWEKFWGFSISSGLRRCWPPLLCLLDDDILKNDNEMVPTQFEVFWWEKKLRHNFISRSTSLFLSTYYKKNFTSEASPRVKMKNKKVLLIARLLDELWNWAEVTTRNLAPNSKFIISINPKKHMYFHFYFWSD